MMRDRLSTLAQGTSMLRRIYAVSAQKALKCGYVSPFCCIDEAVHVIHWVRQCWKTGRSAG
eukprot:11183281-Lingulodinium_polyedra.AAC.1